MSNNDNVEVFWTRGDIHSRVHLAMKNANLINKSLEIEEMKLKSLRNNIIISILAVVIFILLVF